MKYNFYVEKAEDVNIPKIIEENPDETALLLVGENALVILKIDAFPVNYQDKFEIGGGFVCDSWGNRQATTSQNDNAVHFSAGWGKTLPDGWRCVIIDKHEIGAAKEKINLMREFKRKLEVRVSSL